MWYLSQEWGRKSYSCFLLNIIIIIIIINPFFIFKENSLRAFTLLSAAGKDISSQFVPTSLITDILQIYFGVPLFLLHWCFHSKVAIGISQFFLYVWLIHLNFIFLFCTFIPSCPVAFHKYLLEIMFGHHTFRMYLINLWTKIKTSRQSEWRPTAYRQSHN
jgi:hypothetical protein